MHRFFVCPDQIVNSRASFAEDEARHIEKVLRLKKGALIILFDGTGLEYQAVLSGRENKVLQAEVIEVVQAKTIAPVKISLVQGIAKGDKMDTIIQKAVEIGVSDIYPVTCERSLVRLTAEKAENRRARWQQIAREACKQCRSNTIPHVNPITSFSEFLLHLSAGSKLIMLYEKEREIGLKRLLQEKRSEFYGQEIFLLIGPEGGFAEHEVRQAGDQGAIPVTLGARILRTETAGLVAAAMVLYEYDDLG